MDNSCATCASSYGSALDPASEKPLLPGRHLACCNRSICSRCLNQNKRYESYCPYCQISTEPSPLLPQGLRDPPAYDSLDERKKPAKQEIETNSDDELPAYSTHAQQIPPPSEKAPIEDTREEDVLHFVTPSDSMHSLALAYNVPISALRKTNNIYADHLVQARRTVLIPGEYYKGGVSLSPRPVEGEEEEMRRHKVRRWMVGCKVAEYDVALLYLQQADWDLDIAIQAYKDDEKWERDHPIEARAKKGKMNAKSVGMRRFVGTADAGAR